MGTENGVLASARRERTSDAASSIGTLRFPMDGDPQYGAPDTLDGQAAAAQNWVPQPHQHWHWHDGTLSPNEFLRDVQREKRRAERSNSPISLVSYRLDDAVIRDPHQLERLLAALHGSKRETDALGHVSRNTIAVLCPHTDDSGARSFIRKLEPVLEGLPCSAVASTYPDDLFDSLARGSATEVAFQPFLISSNSPAASGEYRLKRWLDVCTALTLLVLLSPLMLIVAAAVKWTSRGPAIYKQRRLGKDGIQFTFYKFRSMVANVDDGIHREFVKRLIRAGDNPAPGETEEPSAYKLKADPRITRVGRLIRMTSIDELPQLFNVLKGDMSMVGPRPPIPYEAKSYEPWHLRRILTVRPGITGLWQVEGRSRVTFSEMVRMDLRYIRDCSPKLDLRIMLKTVLVVIRCDGAG